MAALGAEHDAADELGLRVALGSVFALVGIAPE
jgi:hypothetical protein